MKSKNHRPIFAVIHAIDFLVVALIRWYQATISPDHGWGRVIFPRAGCKYFPSCSEYTKQAVEHYGAGQGLALGIARLGRCNPWSGGGFDPLL